jgi:hypothetical protein
MAAAAIGAVLVTELELDQEHAGEHGRQRRSALC